MPASAESSRSWLQKASELSERIDSGILTPWSAAWRRGDAEAYGQLFSESAAASPWNAARTQRKKFDGIFEYGWEDTSSPRTGRAAIVKDAAKYLKGFKEIEHMELTLLELSPAAGSAPEIASASELIAKLRVDVRGLAGRHARRNDRGRLDLRLRRVDSGWKIVKLERSDMETLTARDQRFEDVTARAGLGSIPVHERLEAIRRGGYALAVGDYDADGAPDVLVGGWGPMSLYRNQRDGTFREVSAESGLKRESRVKAALIADMDGDGRRDLVLQRFIDEPGREMVYYRNDGSGRFSQISVADDSKLKRGRAMSMAAADFDGNGLLDLYVAYPGVHDFTDPWIDDSPGVTHHALLLNRGDWKFSDGGALSGAQFLNDLVRTHSALATDVNGDGKADLIVVDDRGNSNRLYINQGGARLADDRSSGLHNQGWGMMAVSGDYNGDGREDIYFTNIDLSAGRRLKHWISKDHDSARELNPGLDRMANLLEGNRLYRGMQDGSYRDVTDKAGVGWAGEAPAGAEWFDYDNDGLLDLYVANGLWSDEPGRDYSDSFIREQLDIAPQAGGQAVEPNQTMARLKAAKQSFAGRQRNRLFRNNGDGAFTEIGYLAGVDRLEDGYVVAFADYNSDGHLDILLRNTDPARAGLTASPITLLRNKGGENRMLSVHLAPRSGADAVGARVTLKSAGRVQTREIRSVVGAVQSEAAAFFGLGQSLNAESVEVRWPSGAIDRFADLKPGPVLLREGSSEAHYLTRQ